MALYLRRMAHRIPNTMEDRVDLSTVRRRAADIALPARQRRAGKSL